ncbi:hypothetical protein FRC06_006667 [Ceratobasidium sp. 370]|nr:hypothetical protein FRC06_006667 [Ceratobasidium sp. 370]
MIARIAARPARVASARIGAVRFYTENQFGRKEKAHEGTYRVDHSVAEYLIPSVHLDEYVRKHQQEQLKKLRDALEKSKAATAELERQVKEHEEKSNSKP